MLFLMVAFSPELGIAAFIGVKCGIYIAAGAVLRRAYPETKTTAWIIGSVRLVAGLAAGFFYFLIWNRLVNLLSGPLSRPVFFVLGLGIVSLIVWTALITAFCDPRWLTPVRTLGWAAAGTILSLVIDGAGFLLAVPKFGMC